MSAACEDWLKAASSDDGVVAELLLRLHVDTPPSKPKSMLEWSVRQRRSKPSSIGKHLRTQAQRASPTTPLSWSCDTSISGGSTGSGGGGYDDCSRLPTQKLFTTTRSKTLSEVKDEEGSLLEEWSINENMKRLKVDSETWSSCRDESRMNVKFVVPDLNIPFEEENQCQLL